MIERTVEATIIAYLLELASQVKKGGELQCQPYGITTQQWLILLHLAGDPNMPFFSRHSRHNGSPVLASELAAFFNVSRANVTNLLNALLDKGLVAQVGDGKDRRKKLLQLTEEGRRVVKMLEPVRHATNSRLFAVFSPEEKAVLLKCVEQVVKPLANVSAVKSAAKPKQLEQRLAQMC